MRFTTKANGDSFAMIIGISRMHRLLARLLGVGMPFQLQEMLTLVKAPEGSCFLTCSARAANPFCGNASTWAGGSMAAIRKKLLVSSAKAEFNCQGFLKPGQFFPCLSSRSFKGQKVTRWKGSDPAAANKRNPIAHFLMVRDWKQTTTSCRKNNLGNNSCCSMLVQMARIAG